MIDPLPGIVAFLSDFGLQDGYVGEVHGVILRTNASLRVVDVSHLVPPGDIRTGAFLLKRVRETFPPGSVFLAVIDPGVGTSRRPVAVRDRLGVLVGPDNGLLSWSADPDGEWRLISPEHRSPRSRSRTFDGRDLFGPVAGGIAAGRLSFEDIGPVLLDPVRLPFPSWSGRDRRLRGEVLHVDRFGNVLVSIPGDVWTRSVPPRVSLTVRCRGAAHPAVHGVYGDSRGLTVHEDSSGFVEVSLQGSSAAHLLGAGPGDSVEIEP